MKPATILLLICAMLVNVGDGNATETKPFTGEAKTQYRSNKHNY